MTAKALYRPNPSPEGPRLAAWIAMVLELSMATTFIYHQSIVGGVLCLLYVRFTATFSIL